LVLIRFSADKKLFWYLDNFYVGQKLYYGLVKDKNFSFCVVPCVWFVLFLKQFYKSNSGQLKLSYHVLHFIAYQTPLQNVKI